jgi:hypothetical protein
MKNKLDIIKSHGLEVKEIEPTVYKVLNTDKEINIEHLQWELKESILITSDIIRYDKETNGSHTIVANVYYVLTDYNNRELGYKYDDIAEAEFETELYMPFKLSTDPTKSIDTIFREY